MRGNFSLMCLMLSFAPLLGHAQDSAPFDPVKSTARKVGELICHPFDGSDKVKSLAGIVFVGEHHGTKETPQMFGSLICNAGKNQRRVHVAFELPEDWTGPLSEYINSGEDANALPRFLLQTRWSQSVEKNPDGRTSRAFVELLQYLRLLRRSGYQISISSFDTRQWEYKKTNTDIGMAAVLTRNIAKNKVDVTFVLSGEYHTRLFENTTPSKPQPMAFLVSAARPDWDVSAIVVTYSAGAMWGCSVTSCGELQQPTRIPLDIPRLTINQTRDQLGYSGVLYVGAISASPPFVSDNR